MSLEMAKREEPSRSRQIQGGRRAAPVANPPSELTEGLWSLGPAHARRAAAGASMSVESFAHETKNRHAVKRDG